MKKAFKTVLTLTFAAMLFSPVAQAHESTLSSDEVVQALRTFAGDASQDLAKVVEGIFAESGRPSAMIVGSEVQGSFFVGYRKGSGHFVLPGQAPNQAQEIYWNAPSIGVNVGASASKVAVLVYGTASREALLQRFASVQGSYHIIAGAGVSYLRSNLDKDAIQLAYISVGVGLDAGVAIESLSFTKTDRWL